jgi:DNA-binding transcriptional ArsR family regulator
MKILVDAGIVRCRKQGKWSYYSINHDTLALVSEYTMKWS